MKRQPTILSLLMALVCFIVLDVSCLTAPSGAQTADQTAEGHRARTSNCVRKSSMHSLYRAKECAVRSAVSI